MDVEQIFRGIDFFWRDDGTASTLESLLCKYMSEITNTCKNNLSTPFSRVMSLQDASVLLFEFLNNS
jgi:hypothetical protein